ncbi:MAG: Brp/Blh family beta-carotene 15,15'-dioxygenase, partial [Chloroflexota bacterium]
MLNQSLNRTVFYSAWLILTVFLLLEWLGLSLRNGWEFVPFVVSMLFLGLPHGAIDHLVPYRLQQSSVTIRSLILFLVGYLLIAGFYGVFWWLTTAASAIFFILLTWFHWGQGELYIVEKFISPRKRSAGWSLLIVLVRGGLPMLVPLFAFPDVYIQFVNQMIGVVSSGALISIPTDSLPTW